MERLISRILLVSNDRNECNAVITAVARTGARLVFAHDAQHAMDEIADSDEFPHLIIQYFGRAQMDEPLKLYQFARSHALMRHSPFLFIVETEFESTMLKTLRLENFFCVLGPLTYASLVFALPALGIRIEDSILFQATPLAKVSDPDILHS